MKKSLFFIFFSIIIILGVSVLALPEPVKADEGYPYTIPNGLTFHQNDYAFFINNNDNYSVIKILELNDSNWIQIQYIKTTENGKTVGSTNWSELSTWTWDNDIWFVLSVSQNDFDDSDISNLVQLYKNNQLVTQKYSYSGATGLFIDNGYIDVTDLSVNPWGGSSSEPSDPDADPDDPDSDDPVINVGDLTVNVDNTELINEIQDSTIKLQTLLFVTIFVLSLIFGCIVAHNIGINKL